MRGRRGDTSEEEAESARGTRLSRKHGIANPRLFPSPPLYSSGSEYRATRKWNIDISSIYGYTGAKAPRQRYTHKRINTVARTIPRVLPLSSPQLQFPVFLRARARASASPLSRRVARFPRYRASLDFISCYLFPRISRIMNNPPAPRADPAARPSISTARNKTFNSADSGHHKDPAR